MSRLPECPERAGCNSGSEDRHPEDFRLRKETDSSKGHTRKPDLKDKREKYKTECEGERARREERREVEERERMCIKHKHLWASDPMLEW